MHTSGDVQRKKSALQLHGSNGDSGFKEEEEEDEEYDDMKHVKSRMSKFSRGVLKVCMRSLGTCIARYGPVDYC